MDKLIKYLNAMARDEQILFALRCGTSAGYLRKAASSGQLLAIPTCVLIEQESDSAVTRKDLRPDDWMANWPELITQPPDRKPKTASRSR